MVQSLLCLQEMVVQPLQWQHCNIATKYYTVQQNKPCACSHHTKIFEDLLNNLGVIRERKHVLNMKNLATNEKKSSWGKLFSLCTKFIQNWPIIGPSSQVTFTRISRKTIGWFSLYGVCNKWWCNHCSGKIATLQQNGIPSRKIPHTHIVIKQSFMKIG